MSVRYDHPNVLVRRETRLGATTAGTTSVTTFLLDNPGTARLKAVHFLPTTVGTSDTGSQTIRTISAGTTTTSVGISSIGTAAVNVEASINTVVLGASNSPPGVEVAAGSLLTITNGVDGTVVTNVLVEWEALPDSVLS